MPRPSIRPQSDPGLSFAKKRFRRLKMESKPQSATMMLARRMAASGDFLRRSASHPGRRPHDNRSQRHKPSQVDSVKPTVATADAPRERRKKYRPLQTPIHRPSRASWHRTTGIARQCCLSLKSIPVPPDGVSSSPRETHEPGCGAASSVWHDAGNADPVFGFRYHGNSRSESKAAQALGTMNWLNQ